LLWLFDSPKIAAFFSFVQGFLLFVSSLGSVVWRGIISADALSAEDGLLLSDDDSVSFCAPPLWSSFNLSRNVEPTAFAGDLILLTTECGIDIKLLSVFGVGSTTAAGFSLTSLFNG
jgi:hypothetical protein